MASKKPTPKVSRISRDRTVAYARKQKPGAGTDEPSAEATTEAATEAASEAATEATADRAAPSDAAPATTTTKLHERASRATASPTDVTEPMQAVTPGSVMPTDVIAPSAMQTPIAAAPTDVTAPMQAMTPALSVDDADDVRPAAPGERARARMATVSMPVLVSVGAPPEMPSGPAAVAAPIDPQVAEAPTRMPGPREIPGGSPDDPASPPGKVPSGDSRSMRRRTERYEFALIYRIQTYVICRFGAVGTRGQWRVVEYPTSASASHAYAKEVSRFVSEGFSDYRD
jgi:hypothetical protein